MQLSAACPALMGDKEMTMKSSKTRTSEDVSVMGLYSSNCCGEELIFQVNDTFTRCPKCEGLCTWELVEELILAGELDAETPKAA
jgi:hypothetical protein